MEYNLKKLFFYIIISTETNKKLYLEMGNKMESTFSDSMKEKWNLIKETIRKEYELSNISYSTWIEPLKFYKAEDNNILIIIPMDQAHAINYISNKYTSFFQVTITEMMDKDCTVTFILEKDIEDESASTENSKKNVYNIL